MVTVAEGMVTLIVGEVGTPVVMNSDALELGENIDGIHRFSSPFGMRLIVGQGGCADNVQPMEFAFNAQAALVEVGCVKLSV